MKVAIGSSILAGIVIFCATINLLFPTGAAVIPQLVALAIGGFLLVLARRNWAKYFADQILARQRAMETPQERWYRNVRENLPPAPLGYMWELTWTHNTDGNAYVILKAIPTSVIGEPEELLNQYLQDGSCYLAKNAAEMFRKRILFGGTTERTDVIG